MNKLLLIIFLYLFKFPTSGHTQTQKTNMNSLETWERKYFTKPLDSSFIFFCVYGNFSADFKISEQKYRTGGLPFGCDLMKYSSNSHPEYVKSFLEGYLWESLKNTDSTLAAQIAASGECFIIKGEFKDTSNLDHLRDIIGIITYLLDSGGNSVYDPQGFRFFSKQEWMDNVFNQAGPVP